MFRNLWENIRKDMPKKGRGKSDDDLDPLMLPTRLQTAIQVLYGHYEQTFHLWQARGIKVPPCFIVVCQNTAISKLVYDVLGIRAFGTQLLCEQVIGRALRRQSYDLNEDGLFNVEYADVFGIPFDFTAKPVVAPPQPPRETIQVKAVRPERDALEIRFPRVEGYRVELPEERLTAAFNDDSILELTPDLAGPSITRNSGIIGESVDMNLKHLGDIRPSTLVFHLTQRLLGVDENDELIDTLREESPEYGTKQSFPQMILENPKIAGVQQAHKEDRINHLGDEVMKVFKVR